MRFLCFILLLVACDSGLKPQKLETDRIVIKSHSGDSHTFTVQIADEPDEQQTGLMHRKSMPDDVGMLFVFPDSAPRKFWMKNTLIPLDMLFIEDNVIFHVHDSAIPHDLTGVPSYGNADMVLEINGGRARVLGITEGAKLIRN